MKNFKIKYFVVLVSFTLLLSCQTETVVSDSIVATSKKQPLPDGIPSEADDIYAFETSQYYREGKLITDTIVIKDLLKDCKLLFVDGNRKEIYKTNQEAERFKAKLNNNNNNKGTLALDGDNYMHYFFEVQWQGIGIYSNSYSLYYFSLLGPKQTSDAVSSNMDYYKMTDGSLPTFVQTIIYRPNNTYVIPISYYLTSDSYHDSRFTMNVNNITRFRRSLTIISTDGRNIIANIYPNGTLKYDGRHRSNGADRNFAGMAGFEIDKYYSNRN